MHKSHLKMNSDSRGFPEWDSLYKNQRVETMPWYEENLDYDLEGRDI
jgi:hypothetical protein